MAESQSYVAECVYWHHLLPCLSGVYVMGVCFCVCLHASCALPHAASVFSKRARSARWLLLLLVYINQFVLLHVFRLNN